ncbi:MAG: response regulator [Oligoflexales bacterium]
MVFVDKSAKIMIVAQSGAERQLFSSTLKKSNYDGIRTVASIKDAVGVLEVELIDWVLSTLFKGSEYNALALLELISSRFALKDTRVTLVLEQEESEILPTAYELGLLNHILKPFNKDSLLDLFDNFHKNFEQFSWSHARFAAASLRQYLQAEKKHQSLLNLEKGMLGLFPGELEYLLNMAKPQLALGMKDKAKASLCQAKLIAFGQDSKVNEVAREVLGEEEAEKLDENHQSGAAINSLGLKKCVIIDSDDAARKLCADSLKNLGIEQVLEFDNGESAWQWLSVNKDFDLILQEWRIPKLTGPLLVQRIRQKFPVCPIIAISSLLGEDDIPLVQEMGIASIVKKPLNKDDLTKRVVYVVQQDRVPTKVQVLEDKIRRLLEAKKYKEALALREKFKRNKDIPEARKKIIEAEFAYSESKFEKARDLAMEVLRTQSDSINILNFIGKCLMQLNDFVAALKCFKKAQTMSPKNVQRLCAIAEASNEVGDSKSAGEAIEQAQKIDHGNQAIEQTQITMDISSGNTEKAKAVLENLESLSNVVSYLNNKAIACARSGLFDDGINLYKKTLESIPQKRMEHKSIVSYNLALAFARMDKLDEAINQLEMVMGLGKSQVYLKAKSLLAKINKAQKYGSKLQLNESNESKDTDTIQSEIKRLNAEKKPGKKDEKREESSLKQHNEIIAAMDSDPGDLCCYRVFVNPEKSSPIVGGLLKHKIRFTPREVVARQEAAGLEKLLKRES